MEIIVCVKRVPLTQEVDLEISPQKTDVRKDMLAYSINEWDNYAIEEAVQLREKLGGNVTAVTVGNEEDEEVLRRCLAMGADKAIRVDPGNLLHQGLGFSSGHVGDADDDIGASGSRRRQSESWRRLPRRCGTKHC